MSCSMISTAMFGASLAIASRMMAFRARHAGRRLVEQQEFRPLRQRDRDFDQPLAAIGQFRHRLPASATSASDCR